MDDPFNANTEDNGLLFHGKEAASALQKKSTSSAAPLAMWSRDSQSRCLMSDWKILVDLEPSAGNEQEEASPRLERQSYFVHRIYLVLGQRASDYFGKICLDDGDPCSFSNSFSESKTNTSHITLCTAAMDVFPSLLDFLYYQDQHFAITETNAVALYYLADYFGVQQLRERVLWFCNDSITWENVESFYHDACSLHQEPIIGAVETFLVVEIPNLKSNDFQSILFVDIETFATVLETIMRTQRIASCFGPRDDADMSRHLSRLVAFFATRTTSLSMEEMNLVTDSKIIPIVDPAAAVDLLTLEMTVLSVCDPQANKKERGPSDLRKRCLLAIQINLELYPASILDDEPLMNFLRASDGSLAVELLCSVLMQLQIQCIKVKADHADKDRRIGLLEQTVQSLQKQILCSVQRQARYKGRIEDLERWCEIADAYIESLDRRMLQRHDPLLVDEGLECPTIVSNRAYLTIAGHEPGHSLEG